MSARTKTVIARVTTAQKSDFSKVCDAHKMSPSEALRRLVRAFTADPSIINGR